VSLDKILIVVYKWFNGTSIKQEQSEVNLSKNTIIKIQNRMRRLCDIYFEENPLRLGGKGVICQIDESMFKNKQKYHQGRSAPQERWVFGIADTSSSPANYFVQLVPNKKRETLLPIIIDTCLPQTIIWSDEWRAYRNLNSYGFMHETVNHSLNFINPISGVHTQSIESLWNKLKSRLKALMGLSNNSLKEHLKEWMYKDNIAQGNFQYVINFSVKL